MDPNIIELLEGDEDDIMHCGADVEAFSAALIRDMEADTSTMHCGVFPHGSSSNSNQLAATSPDSNQDGHINAKDKDVVKNSMLPDNSSQTEVKQHVLGSENQEQYVGHSQEHSSLDLQHKHEQLQEQAEQKLLFSKKGGEQDRTCQLEIQHQYPQTHKMDYQQVAVAESETCNKQVSFARLLQAVTPYLDKDKAMHLQALYTKLRKNEIPKDGFTRQIRNIVGDQMLGQAVHKIQMQQTKAQSAQNLQMKSHHLQVQPQTSLQQQQEAKMPYLNASEVKDSQAFSQLQQMDHKVPADSAQNPNAKVEVQNDSSFLKRESIVQKRESEPKSESHGMLVNQVSSSSRHAINQDRLPAIQGIDKNQKQHLHPPHTSYPMYGPHISNYHPRSYSGHSVGVSSTSAKSQTQATQVRQVPRQQGMLETQSGGTTQPMSSTNAQRFESQNFSDGFERWLDSSVPFIKQGVRGQTQDQHISQKPASLDSTSFSSSKFHQGNPAPPVTDSIQVSMSTQLDSLMQVHTEVASTVTPLSRGTNIKIPPEKPSIGRKKPFDTLGAPSSLENKKQKVSGVLMEKVKQLNDVTTVSGVDLREEEEQMFSGTKGESRASEATRKVVQEEEKKLMLEKVPFQKKMAKIMSKCGIKNVNKDVEHCLSLCLEERIRGIISNLIGVSKKRSDSERPRHRNIITSDVRRHILAINQKRKGDMEKKQAEEAEKLRKINEADENTGSNAEKDKDKCRKRPIKANNEKDEKMKTNVAARVAVGGDDMLSKWKLMAEEARQKRGEVDSTYVIHVGKDVSHNSSSNTEKMARETLNGENRGTFTAVTSGTAKTFGRNPAIMPHTKVVRTISIKDVIAILEREPEMSKSTLVSRLYERKASEARTAE